LPVRDFPIFLGVFDEASIARPVEQLICNQQVIGSNPIAGSIRNYIDCKDLWNNRRSGLRWDVFSL
jgi:hypothetical protein